MHVHAKAPRKGRPADETDPFWYLTSTHGNEAGLKWIAFAGAVAIHAAVLFVTLPEVSLPAVPRDEPHVVVVRRYVPPPPRVERPRTARQRLTRRIPIPDPTPMEPEPIREPEPEILPEPLPDDVQILIGDPGPPPVPESAPRIAGVGGVTNPVRIEDSYVQPRYPDLARIARVEGNVILQAIIDRDGVVGELRVLRSSQPGFGFEDSAIAAVSRWRYEPATQDGRPVEVYFTIVVDFDLI